MDEENFYKQRAKVRWLNEGDANTRYFDLMTILGVQDAVVDPFMPEEMFTRRLSIAGGRRITDNILMAHELVSGYKRNEGSPRCAFKIDVQKSYDTVDWHFLQNMLAGMGFHPVMVRWIGEMKCISEADSFGYHKGCHSLMLTHLCFADDLFVFTRGDVASVEVLKKALDMFKRRSGLSPSLAKSAIFFANVPETKYDILGCLPFYGGYLSYSSLSSVISYGHKEVVWDEVCKLKKNSNTSWVWHKLLDIWDHLRSLFVIQIGDGMSTNAWEDKWLPNGTLANFLCYRLMHASGFNSLSTVYDVVNQLDDNWLET
ncbi:uncharacterized protein LOC112527507 [Cynara cardunculus var. scolymus]|uniref:uncharacterized protein LOC112527507 n=1 Tax=Cynara cardunculus var. scolymus TaxID=59895 RepID=UPI000D626317|nr:uncharacterized protein LOC112527507 [Cynara cardunculus var. scolymus]